MQVITNLLTGKHRYLFGSFLLLCICLICLAFTMGGDGFDKSRREILMRKIGHETLLLAGDSTSRVLPVKKIGDDEYQISFENQFSFHPEMLVNTTRTLLALEATDYVVNVLNCQNSAVAYGYVISNNKKDDLVSCNGRNQPKECYVINIKFKPAGITTNQFLLGGIPLLALIGLLFFRSSKASTVEAKAEDTGAIRLGSVLFDPNNRKLSVNGESTDLTATESRVFLIFALSPNEIIERSRLQKEIWEDEGVIVGRSLDMFISKLRKKLEADPDVKIVVVRGKGYKLDVNV